MGEPGPMTAPPLRVVILGSSGFLGRALHGELTRTGVEVVAHSSKTLDLSRPEAAEVLVGQLDPGTMLVFASALTPDRGQTIETYSANVAMAASVARALERQPAPCVYISSDAVYGFDVNPVTEETAVAPGGYYALAKYTGEKFKEAGKAADPPAKSSWQNVKEGANDFGRSVKNFFTTLFSK